MLKAEDQRPQARKMASDIQEAIKQAFTRHKRTVDRLNDEKKFGGPLNKNDKSQKIYADLFELSRQLKSVEKKVRECEKLRKERRELFEKKAGGFAESLASLSKNKNIRIKVDVQIENLITRSKEAVHFVLEALSKFEKEASAFCGKAYDNKPAVQRGFLELSQLGFLWENIPKFDSVTNDSVKQLYLAVNYEPSDFKDLENELAKLWPKPKEPQKVSQKPSPPPPPPPEPIIVKSDLQLAHQLLHGFTRSQQIQKAMKLYQDQASKDIVDPSAFNALGQIYEEGKFVAKDVKKSFFFYKKSAEKKDPQGLYRVGKMLEKGVLNFKQQFQGLYANRSAQIRGGIEYYQKAAARGHLDAMTDLGFIYEKGITNDSGLEYIIEPHLDHSIKYYQKAKKEQFPRAMNNLGNLLISQNIISTSASQTSNLQKGIKYLEAAVACKYPKALINLGKCYLTGTGTEVNSQKARGLFRDAALLSDSQGRLEYIKSYIGTNLEEVTTMNELVQSARQVLLENPFNAEAQYLMGVFSERGIGVTSNKEASFHYIASSARLDYPPALTRLGDYYYSGYFVGKNLENARVLYEKAGQKGDSQALLNLAIMQENGLLPQGTALGQPETLYKRAEQLGNTNATLLKGLKKEGKLANNSKVIEAAEKGNLRALKLLNHGDKTAMNSTINQNQFKKLSTFYLKQTNLQKKGFDRSFA